MLLIHEDLDDFEVFHKETIRYFWIERLHSMVMNTNRQRSLQSQMMLCPLMQPNRRRFDLECTVKCYSYLSKMNNSRTKGIIRCISPFVGSKIVNFSADMAVRIWWWTSCQSHASIICQSKSTIMITCRWSDLGEVFTIKTKWNVFKWILSR